MVSYGSRRSWASIWRTKCLKWSAAAWVMLVWSRKLTSKSRFFDFFKNFSKVFSLAPGHSKNMFWGIFKWFWSFSDDFWKPEKLMFRTCYGAYLVDFPGSSALFGAKHGFLWLQKITSFNLTYQMPEMISCSLSYGSLNQKVDITLFMFFNVSEHNSSYRNSF